MCGPGTEIGAAFAAAARSYDAERRALVPDFDGFYGAALAALPFAPGAAPRLLDLGAGTGLLSGMIQAAWPAAECVLIDLASDMIARAQARFAALGATPLCVVADYAEADWPGGPFDAVVSALSIHHLSDEAKRALYRRILTALRPGGVFVNAEQVLGRGAAEEAAWGAAWEAEARASGITEAALAQARARMRHDQSATLEDQLDWLRAAGYVEGFCAYERRRFAVFGGRKGA
jgi:tRNA (cmo5U34)-methyltransferase